MSRERRALRSLSQPGVALDVIRKAANAVQNV